MKTTSTVLASCAILLASDYLGLTQQARESRAEVKIPLIVMDQVPLLDAVRNLARQASLNYMLNPSLSGNTARPDGSVLRERTINIRWENVTAREALERVLKENKLKLVDNPATTIARIVPKDLPVEPVSAAVVGTDTNAVIPLLVMDDVPLRDALQSLLGQMRLEMVLDDAMSRPPHEKLLSELVSFRCERVTARQALAALLDNYGLVKTENVATGSARICLNTKSGTEKR